MTVYESTKNYLESLELHGELEVLSGLALGLASTYDREGLTATAAELRRTLGDIRRLLEGSPEPLDAIDQILKR